MIPTRPAVGSLLLALGLTLPVSISAEDDPPLPMPVETLDASQEAPTGQPVSPAQASRITTRAYKLYLELQANRQGMRDASTPISNKLRTLSGMVRILGEPIQSDEEVEKLEREKGQLEHNLRRVELQLEAARLQDPKVRAERLTEVQAERVEVQAELEKVREPFIAEQNQLQEEARAINPELYNILSAYFQPGQAPRRAEGVLLRVRAESGFINVQWLNEERKPMVLAAIAIRPEPLIPEGAALLKDRYWIERSSANNLVLWVNSFQINFRVHHRPWQGEDQLIEMIQDMIDLEGLDTIDTDLGGSGVV